jgi:hypothetical protein
MAHVHPTMDGVVRDSKGGRHHLQTWQTWDADAAFVKERPDLFSVEPVGGVVHGRRDVPVEQATAAPGEKRTARRG